MSPDPHSCRRLEALLDRELDGELTSEQRDFMVSHLASCPACRERRSFHAGVRTAIDTALRDESMPGGMAARMLHRLDELQAEDDA